MEELSQPIELRSVVLDCIDIRALSAFYVKLLRWEKTYEDKEWIDIQSPRGGTKLSFQRDPDYVPPAWPDAPPGQQQMLHLDFVLPTDVAMDQVVAHAVACGAKKAEVQYDKRWTVMLDPAGHPFCFLGS
ncbi:MAG: VOC family protein [Clostridiales bacterium]|jgi:catechol-2,3-dioxygenase|nr:VOC family protein [Clostridiales bacterium]